MLTNQEPYVAQPNEDQTNSTLLSITQTLWDNEEEDDPQTLHFIYTYNTILRQ